MSIMSARIGCNHETRGQYHLCFAPTLEGSMATFARHVDVDWNGGLLDGSGTAKAGSGAFSVPVTFPSRIAEKADGKTTPEEFMAAAHAVCYAMVLTNTIGKQGGQASHVRVTATVTADKSEAGIKVTSSHLAAAVEGLKGIDPARSPGAGDRRREGLPDLQRHSRFGHDYRGRAGEVVPAGASQSFGPSVWFDR